MENLKLINGLQELDVCEQLEIHGGESVWYEINYIIGRCSRIIETELDKAF